MPTNEIRWVALSRLGHLSKDKVDPDCAESDSYTSLEDLVKDCGGRVKVSRSLPSEPCIGVRKNDILIGNIRPESRKIWLADGPGCAGRSIIVYRPDSKDVLAEYLFHVLSSERFFAYQQRYAHGTGIPRGDKRKFLEFEIPVPAVDRQRHITDLANQSVSGMRKLVAALESEIELRSMQARQCHVRMLQQGSDARALPLEQLCDRIQLGPYGKFLHKADFIETGVPVINPDDIQSGSIRVGEHVRPEQARALSKWLVHNGDVVITRRGRVGRTAVVDETSDGWLCGTGCIFMTPNVMVDSDYLAYSLSSPHTVAWFESHMPVGTMRTLDPKVLAQLPVYVPSMQGQKQTVRILKQIDQVTDALAAELSKEVLLRRKQHASFLDQLIFRQDEG